MGFLGKLVKNVVTTPAGSAGGGGSQGGGLLSSARRASGGGGRFGKLLGGMMSKPSQPTAQPAMMADGGAVGVGKNHCGTSGGGYHAGKKKK